MKKQKSIFIRLLPWLILLAALAVFVIFVGIPLYAPQETEELDPPEIFFYEGDMDKESLKMENEHLLFEMDPDTTQFTVTEKDTGRVWRSNPADAASDTKAVSTNKGVLQSTMLLYYSPSGGTDIERNNYQYSIENGNFSYEITEDGAIRVTYAIGQIEKVYVIPYAITAERYKMYTDMMSGKDKKKVGGYYSKQTPASLDKLSADEKDAMLALYPSLAEQELYIMKSNISASNKENAEKVFASLGYNQAEYELDQQLIAGKKESEEPVFNVTMEYRLDGEDFVVSVPMQDMRYRSDYPLTYVTVLPMFGAAGLDQEGFMLVPEGGGALINYNNGKIKQNSYFANMYGWDYAMKRKEVISETQALFPVFGMTGNGGSFICVIEGATSYAGIQADVSMRYNSYNYANAKYHVIHGEEYNVSAKTAAIVKMFEKQIPEDTIVQRYCFAESDSYVDMAKTYGEYLKSVYPELNRINEDEDLPVNVELVGAISKTVIKFGTPVDSSVAATTFDDAQTIIEDLRANNIHNLSVRFSGWANGGVNQRVFDKIKVVKQLGGEEDMLELIESAEENGIPLYFDGISCFAYDSGILRGFSPFNDSARYATREQVEIEPYSFVIYLPVDWKDSFQLTSPEYAGQMASNLIEKLDEMDACGVAFRDIGSLLSADYNPKALVTREQVKQMNIETLKEAKDKGQLVLIKEGFDFAIPYADRITDMDLDGTAYSILDASVPFYQIALHGNVEYTGLPINISQDWETELLNCVQYGAGLNFTFMAEDAKIVQETYHSGLYGAYYTDWAEDVKKIVNDYQTSMKGLNQIEIVDHEILGDVTVTTYADGRSVYVNYGFEDCTVEKNVVPARSYFVAGGDR
ncbi:MAG: hypothetical protein IJC48_07610 [Clostridia bacterium]|nr:hypothetical protein [Clostridia bacterium]MBQ4156742.1 hypothetical protein [Clostridia bacterium]